MEAVSAYNDFDRVTPRDTPRTPGRVDPSPRPLLSPTGAAELLRREQPAVVRDARNRKVKCFSDKSDTRAPENEKKFTESLAATAKKINEFAATLNGKEQALHQRQAQSGQIEAKHTSWAEELVRQYNAIEGDVQNARCRYKEIAPIRDHKMVASCCRSLLDIDLGIPPLETINKELTLLLASPLHHTALEFYKEEKRVCESIVKALTIGERIRLIEGVVTRVEEKLKLELPNVASAPIFLKEQTELLYLELLDFTLNMLQQLENAPLPDGRTFYNSVTWWTSWVISETSSKPYVTEAEETRIRGLKEQLHTLVKQIVPKGLEEMQEQELSPAVRFHLGQALKEPLDPEDRFRRHPLVTAVVYKKINSEIEALENIAQGLAMMIRELVQERNSVATGGEAGDIKSYRELLQGLRTAINNQFIRLRNHIIKFNRLHAGWYLVARLLAKAHDVELYLTQLQSVAHRQFTPYGKALGHLFAYVDPQEPELSSNPNYERSLIATERLSDCLDSASQLRRPKQEDTSSRRLRMRLYDVIEQVVCRVGLRSLERTQVEEGMVDRILAHDPLIGFLNVEKEEKELGILPESCQNLLIKGFLRATYYSPQLDPQLDVVLYTLQNASIYKNAFQNTLKKSETFKQHLENYRARSDIETYERELNEIAVIYHLLKGAPFAIGAERFVRYFAAKVKLEELEASQKVIPSVQQQVRLAWIKAVTAPIFTEIEQQIHPDFFEHSLTPLLLTSLFGKESTVANEALTRQLGLLDVSGIPIDSTLSLLLQEWALAELMKAPREFPPHMPFFLYSLFDNYFKKEESRIGWRNLHGVAFMERALYHAQKCFTLIKNERDVIHHALYEEVIARYDAFCVVFDKITELPDSQAGNILKEMAAPFSAELPVEMHPPEADTNIGVARWCVIDATLKYAEKLHSRFLELYARQPNGQFLEKSDDYKAACMLRDAMIALFTKGFPETATVTTSDRTCDKIRSYRDNLGMVLALHTTPMHLKALPSSADIAQEK